MTSVQQQPSGNLPDFNRKGDDKMGLGHTPSTRSAELVAGARAILMESDESNALSRTSGRIVARVISGLDGKTNILWFFPARMLGIEMLTKRVVPADKPNLLLVDVAAGFSPRGLHLARDYPQAEVIEVDLPDVIAEKKARLAKGKIRIPPNLSWIEADLGSTNLKDALNGRQADLITSEGLTLYLTPEENSRFFNMVGESLAPGGHFIVDVYFKEKLQLARRSPNVNNVTSFVLRMVGAVPGMIASVETALNYMQEAGMEGVEYSVAELMTELGQPRPVDVISLMVGTKQGAPTSEKPADSQPVVVTAPQSADTPTPTAAPEAPSAEAAVQTADAPPAPPAPAVATEVPKAPDAPAPAVATEAAPEAPKAPDAPTVVAEAAPEAPKTPDAPAAADSAPSEDDQGKA